MKFNLLAYIRYNFYPDPKFKEGCADPQFIKYWRKVLKRTKYNRQDRSNKLLEFTRDALSQFPDAQVQVRTRNRNEGIIGLRFNPVEGVFINMLHDESDRHYCGGFEMKNTFKCGDLKFENSIFCGGSLSSRRVYYDQVAHESAGYVCSATIFKLLRARYYEQVIEKLNKNLL